MVGWCFGGLVVGWRRERERYLLEALLATQVDRPVAYGVEESRKRRGRVRGRIRGRGSKAKIENEFCGGGLRWGWMVGSRVRFEVGMDGGIEGGV